MAADLLASALPATPTTIHGKENLFKWWNYQKVYVDFCNPPPSQQYLLGIVDEYSCVPEVEVVRSEAAATVTPVLDKLSHHEASPRSWSVIMVLHLIAFEFEQFAQYLGFEHQKVTPRWPEANGCTESFMYKYLRHYWATPHTTAGIAPATMLNGYGLRTKLPEVHFLREDSAARNSDSEEIHKMKFYAERRRKIKLLHPVRVIESWWKWCEVRKATTKFQEKTFDVIGHKGSMIIAQRGPEIKAWNSSHFKGIKANEEPLQAEESETFPGIPELP